MKLVEVITLQADLDRLHDASQRSEEALDVESASAELNRIHEKQKEAEELLSELETSISLVQREKGDLER